MRGYGVLSEITGCVPKGVVPRESGRLRVAGTRVLGADRGQRFWSRISLSVHAFVSICRNARSMFALLSRRVAPSVLALCVVLILAGCGNSTGGSSPSPSRVSAAAPVLGASPGWTSLLNGPSHYGASGAVGPASAHVRRRRSLGAPIASGPVVTASGTAYVAANNGILHAIDVRTGRDRWTFNGGASYGAGDLSTSAVILPSGEVLWPGPRDRLFALSPAGQPLWTLTADGVLTTPSSTKQATCS
jgi:hypothetical protein